MKEKIASIIPSRIQMTTRNQECLWLFTNWLSQSFQILVTTLPSNFFHRKTQNASNSISSIIQAICPKIIYVHFTDLEMGVLSILLNVLKYASRETYYLTNMFYRIKDELSFRFSVHNINVYPAINKAAYQEILREISLETQPR